MYSVLVVDDEIRQREAVIGNVDWQRAGFEVVGGAENGIEALDLLEKLEPDLVLTDIKMPLMTGLELAKRTREIRPATKFVILSGYDDFEYAQEAFKYNVIRYLLKPVSASELTEEFEKIGAEMDREFELLKSGGSDVNLAIVAASVLDRYPGQDTVAALKAALSHPNWYVRYNAAGSLVALGQTEASLKDILDGPDRFAREILAYRLGEAAAAKEAKQTA